MAKTEMIRARVEPELKYQAEEVFSGLGLSPTEAITLFYRVYPGFPTLFCWAVLGFSWVI